MQVAPKKAVGIDYTLTDPEGEVLDTSKGRGPLVYLHGSGGIIPGLERALEGKKTGDEVHAVIAPVDGYGEKDEELIQSVPRSMFQGVNELEVGMQFTARSEQGTHTVTIVDIDTAADTVKIDANHPLAGVELTFDVTIVSIRDASPEELEHGHVHGPGGHHH